MALDPIRWLILNHNEPLVFKGFLNWEVLGWDAERWGNVIGNRNLQFRRGQFQYTPDPQWERTTESVSLSFTDFLQYETKNAKQWIYFDYKHLRDHFTDVKHLRDMISWNTLGFPHLNADDSTIWIGSKGAHTPCHYDTYGCNLIAQIYGKKLWIIFPPEENLFPTRIPYEESSVYSKLNLFSPDVKKFKGITKTTSVVLNPGEVLLLPHGWWHYVENLETAISVNVWIPLPTDDEKRLEESLVQMVVSQLVRDLNDEHRAVILNPNPENQHDLPEINFADAVKMVHACAESCRKKPAKADATFEAESVLKSFDGKIMKLPYLSDAEFQTLLDSQTARFPNDLKLAGDNDESLNKIVDVIDALTNVDVISVVKDKILKR